MICDYLLSRNVKFNDNNNDGIIGKSAKNCKTLLITRLPVGHGGVVNSSRFCFFYLSMSKVELSLMGDTAGFSLYKHAATRFPVQNFSPKCFKTTNFVRFHRECIKHYITMLAWARRVTF